MLNASVVRSLGSAAAVAAISVAVLQFTSSTASAATVAVANQPQFQWAVARMANSGGTMASTAPDEGWTSGR